MRPCVGPIGLASSTCYGPPGRSALRSSRCVPVPGTPPTSGPPTPTTTRPRRGPTCESNSTGRWTRPLAHGLMLAVEPEPGNVVRDAAVARRLLDEVGADHLRIILDAANLIGSPGLDRQADIVAQADRPARARRWSWPTPRTSTRPAGGCPGAGGDRSSCVCVGPGRRRIRPAHWSATASRSTTPPSPDGFSAICAGSGRDPRALHDKRRLPSGVRDRRQRAAGAVATRARRTARTAAAGVPRDGRDPNHPCVPGPRRQRPRATRGSLDRHLHPGCAGATRPSRGEDTGRSRRNLPGGGDRAAACRLPSEPRRAADPCSPRPGSMVRP